MSDILLDILDLTVSFPSHEGMVDAVAGLSLQVCTGEIVGVVGESGSGKSLSALAIMGLLSSPGIIRQGSIMLDGQDVTKMPQKQLRLLRGKEVAMVFQEPLTALNPSLTIGRQLIDTIRAHRPASKAQARSLASRTSLSPTSQRLRLTLRYRRRSWNCFVGSAVSADCRFF
jgi:ABC-type dipeptide/oligopeptide/nickel transport system ATPase component